VTCSEYRLSHNSLATVIAWISSCLLAGGASMLFSDEVRTLWAWWGCFGLCAAVGLDIAARVRESLRNQQMAKAVLERFEKEARIEAAQKLLQRDAVANSHGGS
jgi:hypothetical protein